MNRKSGAIHEAAHAVTARTYGAKVTKATLHDVEFEWPEDHLNFKDNQEGLTSRWYDNISTSIAGVIAEYMYSGEAFWQKIPKAELIESPDIVLIKESLSVQKKVTREIISGMFNNMKTILSDPLVFGAIDRVADGLLDGADIVKDFKKEYPDFIVSQRKRKPQFDASPLIEFVLQSLYEK